MTPPDDTRRHAPLPWGTRTRINAAGIEITAIIDARGTTVFEIANAAEAAQLVTVVNAYYAKVRSDA